jgi:methane/ammonia monooxygenase subunit C
MAIITGTPGEKTGAATPPPHTSTEGSASDIARGGDGLKWALGTGGAVLSVLLFYRIWQLAFAWDYGLDANAPEFSYYWISLLIANLVGISLFGGLACLFVARGCRECAHQRAEHGAVSAVHEMKHIWRLWSIIAAFTVALFSFGFFAEQDAAWHQAVVRDTAFTPSHITLFFGAVPIAIVLAAVIYLYAATRVPHIYARGVPVSLAIFMAGIFLLFMWVAFNEWGHSFWIAEELFSAPLHWGFVVMAFLAFALISVFTMTMGRMVELLESEHEQAV